MIREVTREEIPACADLIQAVLRKWYEADGAVHIGTRKFDFFPFTCGYLKRDL